MNISQHIHKYERKNMHTHTCTCKYIDLKLHNPPTLLLLTKINTHTHSNKHTHIHKNIHRPTNETHSYMRIERKREKYIEK